MIKEGFVLRKMPGMSLVMPVGSNIKEFHGAVMLNETGAFIFERLSMGKSVEETAEELTKEYDVTKERAAASVEKVVKQLEDAGLTE